MRHRHENAKHAPYLWPVSAVALLLLATVFQPTFAGEPVTREVDPIDPSAVTANFDKQLRKMLADGEPVAPDRLRQDLPDEQSFRLATKPPTSAARLSTELYATCRQSVVMVGKFAKCEKCDDWHTKIATGFVIGREGIVVTNRHVIVSDEPMKAIAVQTWDGRLLAIEKVLAVSKLNDLAVLKINADDLVPLPVASQAPVGTRVFVIGHPSKYFYAMTDGIVSGQFVRRDGTSGPKYREMTTTAEFAKGSSGAPVLDETGAVVGIVRRTSTFYADQQKKTNVQMVWRRCVPSSSLLELLGEPAK